MVHRPHEVILPTYGTHSTMTSTFGTHFRKFRTARSRNCFAMYRDRDAGKTAIVDLDAETAISFGELDRITTDIAAFLKVHGVRKGSRVLLLSDECLEKLAALVRYLAHRRAVLPAQHRDRRQGAGRASPQR